MENLQKMQKNWWIMLLEGFTFILMGLFMITMPIFSTFSIAELIGIVVVFGAALQADRAFKLRGQKMFMPTLLSAIFGFVIGYVMMYYPSESALVLSAAVIMYFAIESVLKLSMAMAMKPIGAWKALAFSSLVAAILFVVAITTWPMSASFILGTLFGLNMIGFGVALMVVSFNLRDLGSVSVKL